MMNEDALKVVGKSVLYPCRINSPVVLQLDSFGYKDYNRRRGPLCVPSKCLATTTQPSPPLQQEGSAAPEVRGLLLRAQCQLKQLQHRCM